MPISLACPSRLRWHRPRIGARLALSALFLLFGCTGLQNASAEGDTRSLSFQHTHRDDSLTITFKRNGRYDDEALKKLNYFLRDWRTNEQTEMAPRLFDILWEVYRDVGAKEPIHIISSYRSPQTNAMLRRRSRGVAKFSQHMLGHAMDFFIPGVPLEELRFAGLRLQRGGVGYYPTSGSPFVHLDVGSVRHWPRLPNDQLARVLHGKSKYARSTGGGEASIQTADASSLTPGRGRNFLAKLLRIGGGRDEEEEAETAAPRDGKLAAAAPAPARQQLAAMPMPRSRPARAGEFLLASASRSAPTRPADVISSRGYWPSNAPAQQPEREPDAPAAVAPVAAEPVAPAPAAVQPAAAPSAPAPIRTADAGAASAPREAVSPSGERLAWITGPEGQAAPPRPPRDIEGVPAPAAAPDTTASVASWASNPGQNDRIPTDLALAYAAATQPESSARAVPVPMGSVRPASSANAGNATIATKRPGLNPPAAKIAHRTMDPWLRGLVMTPSVHHSVTVAMLGTTDYRALRPLMHKPKTAVAMVFSNDPLLGLTSLQFSGPAVTFLPTIGSATRTAGLN